MVRAIAKAALLALIVITAVAAFSAQASAQAPIPNACCTYTVDVAGFRDACFPVRLMTRWSTGIQFDIINGNGQFVFPITHTPCPPPPALFAWASLDGGTTLAWWNFPAFTNVNGCCFITRLTNDANGCVIIYLRPC